jgi:hypothetical protein
VKANTKILLPLAGAILLAGMVAAVSFRAFRQIDAAASARRNTFGLIVRGDTCCLN